MNDKLYTTCGNCQIVCVPDKEERKRRFKLLSESGVVLQNENGSLDVVSPEEAEGRLAKMSPENRALYEGDLSNADIPPEIQELAKQYQSK